MENLRNRTSIELINNEERRDKKLCKPNLKRVEIFNENLIGAELKLTNINMNKPIYVGFSVLDLSKLLMYDFHYNFIKKEFPKEDSKLLFSDTDSLCYLLKTNDLNSFYDKNRSKFDLSEFNNYLKDGTNAKTIGKFKSEYPNSDITEFCGIRSKQYALRIGETKTKKVLKGVNRTVVEHDILFDDYVSCLDNKESSERAVVDIVSKKHQVSTISSSKVAFNPFNDKIYVLENGIDCLSYGHYKIG